MATKHDSKDKAPVVKEPVREAKGNPAATELIEAVRVVLPMLSGGLLPFVPTPVFTDAVRKLQAAYDQCR